MSNKVVLTWVVISAIALAACAIVPLRPSNYTLTSPPPYSKNECWVLTHEGVWYDCSVSK